MSQSIEGYHAPGIPRGEFGEASKILEEVAELIDAEAQNNEIMAMTELADIYGALRSVAYSYGLEMIDLEIMANATERAFKSGARHATPRTD